MIFFVLLVLSTSWPFTCATTSSGRGSLAPPSKHVSRKGEINPDHIGLASHRAELIVVVRIISPQRTLNLCRRLQLRWRQPLDY